MIAENLQNLLDQPENLLLVYEIDLVLSVKLFKLQIEPWPFSKGVFSPAYRNSCSSTWCGSMLARIQIIPLLDYVYYYRCFLKVIYFRYLYLGKLEALILSRLVKRFGNNCDLRLNEVRDQLISPSSIDLWFSTREVLPPRGHLAMLDIFGCHISW